MKKKIISLILSISILLTASLVYADSSTTEPNDLQSSDTIPFQETNSSEITASTTTTSSKIEEELATSKETVENSSNKNNENNNDTNKRKMLNTWGNGYTYATVTKGKKLNPQDFVGSIQEIHGIYVKNIDFTDNKAVNTSQIGVFKTTLNITTDDGDLYEATVSYLVKNNVPTIDIYNINYNETKNTISFTVSNPKTIVYLTADSEPVTYECHPDQNGNYETTLYSKKTPTIISLFAMTENGDYSEEVIYLIDKKGTEKKISLSDLSFNFDTNTLMGVTEPNTTITFYIDGEKESSKTVTADGNGNFSYQFNAFPTSIILKLNNNGKEEIYNFSPKKLDGKEVNQIKTDAKVLPRTGEQRKKVGFIVIGILLVLIVILSIIKKSSKVKKQN